MTVYMDRVSLHLDKLRSTYGINRTAVTPATGDLMYERIESGLLVDQREFISLNATLVYASKRTYPTVHFGDQVTRWISNKPLSVRAGEPTTSEIEHYKTGVRVKHNFNKYWSPGLYTSP